GARRHGSRPIRIRAVGGPVRTSGVGPAAGGIGLGSATGRDSAHQSLCRAGAGTAAGRAHRPPGAARSPERPPFAPFAGRSRPPGQPGPRDTWQRRTRPLAGRPAGWLAEQLQGLIGLRLLERLLVELPGSGGARPAVIDAHPLVRRGFEHVLGPEGRRGSATARAGFLSGRPDRKKPVSLDEAREDVELFHAYCQGGLWDEAERVLLALDKPR